MTKNKYFSVSPNLLPKTDPRYKKWRRSLKKRPPPWNKEETKDSHPSVKKISETFKKRGIDNFAKWREKARSEGLIPLFYPPFEKSERLATLVGLALGDGHIHKFPRTEKFTLALGTDKPDLIDYSSLLVEEIFNKKPNIFKPKNVNVVKITLYQKNISERLEVPIGNRRYSKIGLPQWVWGVENYLVACLKGLYEAEGSLSVHLPTYTYNFSFSNRNEKLLKDVQDALVKLGFNPETRPYAIRLRKKNEVKYFRKLINFRNYSAG